MSGNPGFSIQAWLSACGQRYPPATTVQSRGRENSSVFPVEALVLGLSMCLRILQQLGGAQQGL